MYSKQLEMFMKVGELGSFSKAAEALYITPSAVIQQINHMEQELGTRLLNRTKQGTSMTETGQIVWKGGQEILRLSNEIRDQICQLEERGANEVVVGTSYLQKCRLIYEFWMRFAGSGSQYHITIEDIGEICERTQKVDIIETLLYYEVRQQLWQFMEICKVPIVCAVPTNHPLVGHKYLTYEDLKDQTVVTIEPGMCEVLDQLRESLIQHGIRVLDVDRYDISTFSTCIVHGYLLQTPACWQDLYRDMVCIPCEWDYALPYGFVYKENPSRLVEKFLQFAKELCQKETFRLY